jgi:replicative superfamily II helicase
VKVSAFSWYVPAFPEYNVAQSAAIPFLDKDVNLVVSFSTAVGKTVLAECCFAYHLKTNEKCRVTYVCPFRSLASEKYKEWTSESQLAKYGLVLGTGDTGAGLEEHLRARLAVVTTEAFDSKTRSGRWAGWLGSMSCVVFDEAHLLSDSGRGGALEASLMRFSRQNPSSRLVLLSATMSNAMDVAKWVKSLNGKPTKCITSLWRPTEVETKVVGVEGTDKKIEETIRIVSGMSGKKVVVFVHSKITGANIVRQLRREGTRSAFHNASLSSSKRKRIEDAFNDKDSGLNVLVSTSTLGAGVNIG